MYAKHLVKTALTRAELQNREDLNKQCDKNTKDSSASFYLVVTHHPKNLLLRDIVHENCPLLNKSKTILTITDTNLISRLKSFDFDATVVYNMLDRPEIVYTHNPRVTLMT